MYLVGFTTVIGETVLSIINNFIYCCVTSEVDIAILHNLIINYCSVYLVGFTAIIGETVPSIINNFIYCCVTSAVDIVILHNLIITAVCMS